jgi:Protein of unknown function VcgC/VcgE (DUF2780)
MKMADFLSDLASKTGLGNDLAHQGVGALLTMLKDRLGPDALAQLKNAIPNADQIQSSVQDKIQAGGGSLLDTVKSMAGKLLGGSAEDPAAALQNHFASAGLSAEHLQSLLPKLHEMLANKLPPEVLAQIQKHVPGFAPPEE